MTEEAVPKSEIWFRSLIELGPAVYAVLDAQGIILYESPSLESAFGWKPEEVVGRNIFEFIHPEDIEFAKAGLGELGANPGLAMTVEARYRHKNGSWRIVAASGTNLLDNPAVGGIVFTSQDVTKQRQAEGALRESEAKLRSLFENMPDVVVMVHRDGTIRYINHTASGDPPAELIGSSGFESIAPEHRQASQEAVRRAIETREVQSIEVLGIRGNWWSSRLVPMIDGGDVQNVMIICKDITEQRQAIKALEKERKLLQRLLDLHERDRQLVSYEIHDGFAQYLTGARFQLEAYARQRTEAPEKAEATLQTALDMLGQSIVETRRLINGLRPPVLDEFGVVAAVDYLICELREHQSVDIELVHDVQFDRIAAPLESTVFRIVQESLTNACNHAQSDKIRVELIQQDGHVHILVQDWGVGFDPDAVDQGRFGLQGIRERSRLMGGKLTIDTQPGKGTSVAVQLPLTESADED